MLAEDELSDVLLMLGDKQTIYAHKVISPSQNNSELFTCVFRRVAAAEMDIFMAVDNWRSYSRILSISRLRSESSW